MSKGGVEERMAKVEGILEQMDKRLNHIESNIGDLRKEIHSNFKWTLGVVVSMWVTIILGILAIFLKM